MTTGNSYVFDFTDKGSVARLQTRIEGLQRQMESFAQSVNASPTVKRFETQFTQSATAIQTKIRQLKTEIQELQALQAQVRPNLSNELIAKTGITGRTPGFISKTDVSAEIEARRVALAEAYNALQQRAIDGEKQLEAAMARDLQLLEQQNLAAQRRNDLVERLRSISQGGERLAEAIEKRRLLLVERRLALTKLIAEEQNRVAANEATTRGAKIFERQAAALEAQAAATKKAADLRSRLTKVDTQLGTATKLAAVAAPGTEERKAAEEAITRLTAEQAVLKERALAQDGAATSHRREYLRITKEIASLELRSGATKTLADLSNALSKIQAQISQIESGTPAEAAEAILGEDVAGNAANLADSLDRIDLDGVISDDAQQQLSLFGEEADNTIAKMDDLGTKDISPEIDPSELSKGLPLFERTLEGAFEGIGRRFQATLQFAISGALIFSLQRLVREFAQAAIEVERSFVDIGTALEFDIEAPQGTTAFVREVQRVRNEVLGIADDFNVLPSEVNTAAYQMISRFQDVEAAIIATRAQILATQIATIDQAEALRALTAVAEAYGAQLANNADDTERQRLQAKLYADVLDRATVIQQEYGVAVEDTLEGAAGAAELYASLGINQAQLLADVAAIVRRSGQSGQAVYDRLQRFVSRISDPTITKEILKIADASETLNLSWLQFRTDPGAALQSLRSQYAALTQESSGLAQQLAQLFGPREATFVRQYFNTFDLSAEIMDATADSAGRAEQRLSRLLNTMQGSIDGIKSGFQSFAQQLQDLGVLNPFGLILKGGELLLKTLNAIAATVNRIVGALNLIKIPTIGGFGELLTILLAAVTAALTLRRTLDGVSFLIGKSPRAQSFVQGAKDTKNFAPGFIGSAGVPLALQGAMLKASQAGQTLGKTIKGFFISPVDQLKTSILAMWGAFSRLLLSLGIGSKVTDAATVAENRLSAARLLNTLKTRAAAAGGTIPFLLGGLKTLTLGLVRFGSGLAAISLVALGAINAFRTLKDVIDITFGGAPDPTQAVRDRIATRIAQAEDAGVPIDRRSTVREEFQNEIRAIQESGVMEPGENFGEMLGNVATLFSVGTREAAGFVAALAPWIYGEDVGTDYNPLTKQYKLTSQVQDFLAEYIRSIVADLRAQIGQLPEGSTEREALNAQLDDLSLLYGEVQGLDPDEIKKSGGTATERANAYNDLLARQFEVRDSIYAFDDALIDIIEEATAGVTSPEIIKENIQRIQSEQGAGILTSYAVEQLAKEQREEAEKLLRAVRQDPQATDAELKAAQDAYIEAASFEAQAIDARLQLAQRRASLFEDRDQQIIANLQALKIALDHAVARDAYGRIEDLELQILEQETALARIRRDEAMARLRFAADRAKSFDAQIKALTRLKQAIIFEAFRTATFLQLITGQWFGLEELEAIAQINDEIAGIRRERAVIRARLSILEANSTQDNIAAITADIEALKAEIRWMQNEGEEELLIREKQQELREQAARLELALASRRAAYYRLTAGTGDQIKAAQAELKAAEDRLATIISLGGEETEAAYEAELAVLRARERLAQLALRYADLSRRVSSDLTDTYEQALLDLHAAQEALAQADGELEKLEAEKNLIEAENRARQEFYDRQLSDLDFLFRTDQIGQKQYIAALRKLQEGIDRTTRAGEELWREIELQILGLLDSAEDMAFNIPTEIALPTLYEVRRALAADQLGVDYQDNREQYINVYIDEDVDVERVFDAIADRFGSDIDRDAARQTAGGAALTIGGF